jgi:hypothetical protein
LFCFLRQHHVTGCFIKFQKGQKMVRQNSVEEVTSLLETVRYSFDFMATDPNNTARRDACAAGIADFLHREHDRAEADRKARTSAGTEFVPNPYAAPEIDGEVVSLVFGEALTALTAYAIKGATDEEISIQTQADTEQQQA